MLFADIVGHESVKGHLRSMVQSGRISHAMLLSGADGVGALPMAMAYAGYLNCRHRTAEDACGQCPECYRMERMEHADLHYIYPVNTSKEAVSTGRADDKPRSEQFVHIWREVIPATGGYLTEAEWYGAIGIENGQGNINKSEANELLRKMSFKSFEGGYKIVIIWLPERLHEAASNTLLKLIEEPPEKTLFLLVSVEPDKIISTIRSRTQAIALSAVPDDEIRKALLDRGMVADPATAENIAHLSQGSWGTALALSRREPGQSATEHQQYFISLMRLCYTRKYLDLFEWADRIAATGRESQKQFCAASLGMLRECYFTGIGMPELSYMDPERATFCSNFAPYVSNHTIESFVEEFELLLLQIGRNGNPRILFTHFAMSISKIISHARSTLAAGQ